MFALNQIRGGHSHIVAQIVEAEFVVGAERDVAFVCGASLGGVGLMLVDAVDCGAVEHVQRSHPFRVTLRQVVVDGDHVHSASRERSEKYRQGRHEGFAFAGGHFCDLALVENDAADELHVIVDHVPFDLVAAGEPMVFPDGFISVNRHEVASLAGEFAVEVGGGDFDSFVAGEA